MLFAAASQSQRGLSGLRRLMGDQVLLYCLARQLVVHDEPFLSRHEGIVVAVHDFPDWYF
jgi:hypothetical protein